MKSGFSFNLRDMDADTRAAITEAARISGITVADWLKRVMAERDAAAEQAEPAAGEAPAAAELARSMQVLTGRIAAMDERARAAIPTLPARLDAIEQHIGRLSAPGRGKSERTRLLHETAAMVGDLARQIDNADEQARSMIEGLPSRSAMHSTSEKDPLTEVINDLDRRIAAMQQRVSEEVPAPPPPERLSLDEIQARLNTLLDEPAGRSAAPPPRSRTASRPTAAASAAVEATLRALEERIDEAKNRLDRATAIAETRPPAATIDHIQRIEQRLSDIADRLVAAENDRRKPNKETEIANAVREIAAHQKTLDDRAEAAAVRRDQQAIAAAVAALRTDLATLTDQVSAITRIGKEGHGAVFEVAHRLDTMVAERPFDRNMLESMRDEIERMRSLVEVGARQDALDAHGDGISAQLENLLRTVADRTRLDALGEEVAALRHQLESDDSPRAVQRLEMHVAELGRSIDAALSSRHVAPIVERLESRIEALTDRVASLGDPGAQVDAAIRSIGQHLDVRLTDISERLGGLIETTPQTVDMEAAQQRFEASIASIANRLGGVVENATRPQTAAIEAVQRQLEERFEDITERLSGISDNAQERAEVQHVYTRLQSVIERIDRLNSSQKERSPALDAIKSEIGALRKEVVAGKVPPSELDAIRREIASLRTQMAGRAPAADNSELEHQVQQLARQLDIVSKSRHTDEPALAALEAQVARLAKELERSKPQQTGAMNHVEETLGRLQAALADSRQESIAAARKEARRAVAELSEVAAGSEADSTLIKSLMRDLDDLKNASGGTDVNTEVRLESVSQTMNHVVERLSRLESTAEAAPPKKEPEAPKRHPGDWKQTFDRVADSVPEPVVERRSEKASVAPEAAPFVQIDFSAAQRRAEFIAAARRAAQAVAEEAARSKAAPETASEPDETEEVAEERQGAFARISQAIRGRRRPLLLAAAAIVLAIGTVQLYGKFAPTIGHSPFLASARALLSGKSQDRLIANASASVAKSAASPAIVPAPDTGQASVRQILETTAAATTTTPSSSTLVPPSSNPPAQVTFASPDTAATHFSSDGPEIQASAAPLPAAPKATPLPIATPSGASVILTSASTATSAADTGIDAAVGSQKLIAAAGAGDANAEFEVATRYAEGANVPADLAKAAVWYAKAAEGGNAIAQYRLASLYERGQGVGKDLVNAVNWYQRAADQGNVNAMHNLAVLLSEGADGSPDRAKALQWFLGAANYGVRDSQYNLGVIYARGIGTAQDLGQSYKWFALAATQGDTDAAARRDEVAKAMSADDLTKARAAVTAWHAKAPLVEANAISKGNWDDAGGSGLTVADQQGLVAKIQTLLADAGYDPGPADGRMGPKTVDAVRAYQQKVGMPVTGQIDRTLVASLTQPTN